MIFFVCQVSQYTKSLFLENYFLETFELGAGEITKGLGHVFCIQLTLVQTTQTYILYHRQD